MFSLQAQNDALMDELDKYKTLFSPGQQKLLKNGKRITWSDEDISMAASLHAAGSKAYKLLQKRGFPLPSRRTLRRKASMIDVQPGFITPVLPILEDAGTDPLRKYCTISFDDMKIREQYEFDISRGRVLRPCSQAMMMLVRGLYRNYQQIIYYNFDKKPVVELMQSVIEKLNKVGLEPVALTCDMSTKNIALWKSLGVTVENPFFDLSNGKRIFCFPDAPHLLKLCRNHFLDTGFEIDGEFVGADPVKRLLTLQPCDIGTTYRLSADHFPEKGSPKRQNVKMAAQLFSNRVAATLLRVENLDSAKMPKETGKTAEFIKMMNDYFDVFNSRQPVVDSRPFKKAFGFQERKMLKLIC